MIPVKSDTWRQVDIKVDNSLVVRQIDKEANFALHRLLSVWDEDENKDEGENARKPNLADWQLDINMPSIATASSNDYPISCYQSSKVAPEWTQLQSGSDGKPGAGMSPIYQEEDGSIINSAYVYIHVITPPLNFLFETAFPKIHRTLGHVWEETWARSNKNM